MKASKNLKASFYGIFPLIKGKMINPDIIAEEFSKLLSLNKKDYFLIKIHLFFYPSESSQEKNTEKEFWFEKYKNSSSYSEYDLAIELLEILCDYLEDKNENLANQKIDKIPEKFREYKNINYYLFLTSTHINDILIHIYSFFQKDIQYFRTLLNVDVKESDDLTDKATLEKIFGGKTISIFELKTHKYYTNMIIELEKKISYQNELFKSKLNNKDDTIDSLVNQVSSLNDQVNTLNNKVCSLTTEVNGMKETLNKIYVRDTIKYSIKYLYRLFYSKYIKPNSFKNKLYDQITELKIILKRPEFIKYNFVYDFLCAIEFGDLVYLNKTTHPSVEKRNFEDIKKYVDNSKPYLDQLISFLEKLPYLSDYINLEVTFFLNKSKLEEEIEKKYDFSSIYDSVFVH